jgi:hypothetical protein
MFNPGLLIRQCAAPIIGAMSIQRNMPMIVLALAFGLGGTGALAGADPAMSEDAYEAAQDRIEAQAKARRKACAPLKGNAKDVCQLEAKGWEKAAKAQLEAEYQPSPDAEKNAKVARAEADYDIARQRCAPLKDRAKDRCLKQAKHDREAAIRLAKVEKVEEMNTLKAKAAAQQKAAPKS